MAKKAIEETDKCKPRFVALDIGPIGEMLEPMGTLSFDRAYEIFKRQAIQGEKSWCRFNYYRNYDGFV